MYTETQRMIIRNFISEDAQDLYEILGDDETMKNLEPAYSFEKTKDFLASFCIGRSGAFAAVHKESGKVIGYILFNEQEKGVYEMGWIFNRSFWGQGFAYESLKAVIDYAFSKLSAHKVFAETIDAVKSVGLMKKLGMRFECIEPNASKDEYGSPADLHFYGLLDKDWKDQQQKPE